MLLVICLNSSSASAQVPALLRTRSASAVTQPLDHRHAPSVLVVEVACDPSPKLSCAAVIACASHADSYGTNNESYQLSSSGSSANARADYQRASCLLIHRDTVSRSSWHPSILAFLLDAHRTACTAVVARIAGKVLRVGGIRFRRSDRSIWSASHADGTVVELIMRVVQSEGGYAAGPGPVAYHHRTMTRTLVRSVRRRSAHVVIES